MNIFVSIFVVFIFPLSNCFSSFADGITGEVRNFLKTFGTQYYSTFWNMVICESNISS